MSRPRGRPANATTALVPASARADTLTEVEAVLNEEAIELFTTAVGGRDQLAAVLAVAGAGSEVERITTLLLDPRYRSWGLPRLCQMTGITVADLFASYRKANFARAHIKASHIIAERLPPIVTDVMDKALSDPTVERHKLALELGQLLEKKGGLIVQQNNMAAAIGATGAGSLEQLQQAVGDLLFGGGPRRGDVIEPAFVPDPIVLPADPEDEDEDDPDDAHPDLPVPPDLPFEQPDSPPSAPSAPSTPSPDATGQP